METKRIPVIRYIEKYPVDMVKDFFSLDEYDAFKKERFDYICKKFDIYNPLSKFHYSDWKHESFRLNKDGMPRKYYNPVHLQTKESREKQCQKFKEYQEKLKSERVLKRQQKEQLDKEAYDKAIKLLIDNKIDLNRLNIRIKK